MAQEGFLYEENAYKALKKFNISTGVVAGASHTLPDLTIHKPSKIVAKKLSGYQTAGVELKNQPTAAGSLVMKYYKGAWDYGKYNDAEEKIFIHDLAESQALLKNMNTSGTAGKNWRGKVPVLQNDSGGAKIYTGNMSKKKAYEKDIANFGADSEIHLEIPAKAICDYYTKKGCSYINVGTHGFFTLNGRDKLKLNDALKKQKLALIPDFANSASAIIRVRCQFKGSISKGSYDYQFVTTLQFSGVSKSPYNIAPLVKGSKSTIDVKALSASSLISVLQSV